MQQMRLERIAAPLKYWEKTTEKKQTKTGLNATNWIIDINDNWLSAAFDMIICYTRTPHGRNRTSAGLYTRLNSVLLYEYILVYVGPFISQLHSYGSLEINSENAQNVLVRSTVEGSRLSHGLFGFLSHSMRKLIYRPTHSWGIFIFALLTRGLSSTDDTRSSSIEWRSRTE